MLVLYLLLGKSPLSTKVVTYHRLPIYEVWYWCILLQLSSALLNTVRFSSEFEAGMVSVERIRQYAQLPKEAPHVMPSDKLIEKEWPSKGSVEFRNVNFRYRAGTPLVLKGLNIKIPSGAKVGIVGRTGKSLVSEYLNNAMFNFSNLTIGFVNHDYFSSLFCATILKWYRCWKEHSCKCIDTYC